VYLKENLQLLLLLNVSISLAAQVFLLVFIPILPPMISHYITPWWQRTYVPQDHVDCGEWKKDPFGLTMDIKNSIISTPHPLSCPTPAKPYPSGGGPTLTAAHHSSPDPASHDRGTQGLLRARHGRRRHGEIRRRLMRGDSRAQHHHLQVPEQ
jgi:hypothetical protein